MESFPLGQSFHGERRDQANGGGGKGGDFFCKMQGEKDMWYRWENVEEMDDTLREKENGAIFTLM